MAECRPTRHEVRCARLGAPVPCLRRGPGGLAAGDVPPVPDFTQPRDSRQRRCPRRGPSGASISTWRPWRPASPGLLFRPAAALAARAVPAGRSSRWPGWASGARAAFARSARSRTSRWRLAIAPTPCRRPSWRSSCCRWCSRSSSAARSARRSARWGPCRNWSRVRPVQSAACGSTMPWGCWPTSTSARRCSLPARARRLVICRYDPFVGLFRRARAGDAGHRRLLSGAWACSSAGRIAAICAPTGRSWRCFRGWRGGTCGFRRRSASSAGCARMPAPTGRSASRRYAGGRPAAPGRRRLAAAAAAVAGARRCWGRCWGGQLEVPLAEMHPTVQLAERIRLEETQQVEGHDRRQRRLPQHGPAGRPTCIARHRRLSHRLGVAGGWFGAWVGLVLGVKLVHLSVRRRRTDYEPDRAGCVSCGRCFWYCPGEQARHGWITRSVETSTT